MLSPARLPLPQPSPSHRPRPHRGPSPVWQPLTVAAWLLGAGCGPPPDPAPDPTTVLPQDAWVDRLPDPTPDTATAELEASVPGVDDDVDDDADADADAPGTQKGALQGGRATSAYPAVGLVLAEDGGLCTGSLIRPRVVLTAAHCAQGPVAGFFLGSGRATGASDTLTDTLETMEGHRVVARQPHPGWRNDTCGTTPDVALLLLEDPVDGVRPLDVASAAAAWEGRVCTAVGFGTHGSGAAATVGRKRSGAERIVSVRPHAVGVVWDSAVADHGDSGGPLLCGGRISGVTSCGAPGALRQRVVNYARPQAVQAWVTQVLRRWLPPR